MKGLILLLIFIHFPFEIIAKRKAFELNPNLKKTYLTLLNQATDFHNVIGTGNKQKIQTEIKETQEIIAKLYRQIFSISQLHHKIHSHKLLKSIEEQLIVIQSGNSLNPKVKKKSVKKLFNSFFELAQVYDLTKDMSGKIFYCSIDKSLWFQKNGKAKNPINPDYKNCGRVVL